MLPPGVSASVIRGGGNGGDWRTPRGLRILDVRTPGEFETAHIPGAYNVPLDLLREHRTELRTHLDDQVVLVCRSGARATQAGLTLAEVGLPNVKILDGGMLAWQHTDAPINHGRTQWDPERRSSRSGPPCWSFR